VIAFFIVFIINNQIAQFTYQPVEYIIYIAGKTFYFEWRNISMKTNRF